MSIFYRIGTKASVVLAMVLTTGVGSVWAEDATTLSTSGPVPFSNPDESGFGATILLKENFAGALRTADGQPGVVAFDLLRTEPSSLIPGRWQLADGQGSNGTKAAWCGDPIDPANLWLMQDSSKDALGGRLYIRLPSVSVGAPCTLEIKPYLYQQRNVQPNAPINTVLFDPSDPLGITKWAAANPYASQSDIDTWAQPTVNNSAIVMLGRTSAEWSWITTLVTGDNHALNLTCRFREPPVMDTAARTIYVAAILPENSGFFFMDGDGLWHPYAGQGDWPAYKAANGKQGSVHDIVIARNLDVTGLPNGTMIAIGWGKDSAEVAGNNQYVPCYIINGN